MNSFVGNIYILFPTKYKLVKKTNLDEKMTQINDEMDKFDSMPFIALIHHISKNKLTYSMKNPNHIDMVHEGRYLMEIHKRKNLSQDDLANIFVFFWDVVFNISTSKFTHIADFVGGDGVCIYGGRGGRNHWNRAISRIYCHKDFGFSYYGD